MPDPAPPVVVASSSPWWMIAHAIILALALLIVQMNGYVVAPKPVVEPPATKPDQPPATKPDRPPPPVSGPINPVPAAPVVRGPLPPFPGESASAPDAPGTIRTLKVGDHSIRIRVDEAGDWVVVPAPESKDRQPDE